MQEKKCNDCKHRTIFYYCKEYEVDCKIQRAYNFRCKKHWDRERLFKKVIRLLTRIRL